MIQFRIESAFDWYATPSVLTVSKKIRKIYEPVYEDVARREDATLDPQLYHLSNCLVADRRPAWYTHLKTACSLSFFFFDRSGDQKERRLLAPLVAFLAPRIGDPPRGQGVFPRPPIDGTMNRGKYQNPWWPRLSDPSLKWSYAWASLLPSWHIVHERGEHFDLVATMNVRMNLFVAALGTDAKDRRILRVYGFDPEMTVGAGSTDDPSGQSEVSPG